eukprot:GHRQ01034810.1.p1 GENE.GHRQ01034810.1~~GHRQ01034810.1.p1  ORF type:complete len:142 (+),score=30.72 GHRQ01034810.1:333-758(+)
MEGLLGKFQADLGQVSEEIRALQVSAARAGKPGPKYAGALTQGCFAGGAAAGTASAGRRSSVDRTAAAMLSAHLAAGEHHRQSAGTGVICYSQQHCSTYVVVFRTLLPWCVACCRLLLAVAGAVCRCSLPQCPRSCATGAR